MFENWGESRLNREVKTWPVKDSRSSLYSLKEVSILQKQRSRSEKVRVFPREREVD